MRIANLDGRLVIVTGDAGHETGYDVEKNSGGRFRADPQAIYDEWDSFTMWAAAAALQDGDDCFLAIKWRWEVFRPLPRFCNLRTKAPLSANVRLIHLNRAS